MLVKFAIPRKAVNPLKTGYFCQDDEKRPDVLTSLSFIPASKTAIGSS